VNTLVQIYYSNRASSDSNNSSTRHRFTGLAHYPPIRMLSQSLPRSALPSIAPIHLAGSDELNNRLC